MQAGNLKSKYLTDIKPVLKGTLGKKNINEVPALTKIVINSGFGKISVDEKAKEQVVDVLIKIAGQKPVLTKAKKAIAGFKIRKGQIIGAKTTLRGDKMYHFFEKLVSIVLPRLRDFRGVRDNSFDGKGNYTIGFHEANIFPEVEYGRGAKGGGLEVTICTNSKNDAEARTLLASLGMPFADQKKPVSVTAERR